MEMFEKDIKPRDILTKDALHNALRLDMALGCSTNSVLHLLAIANEAGVELNLNMINEISASTPNLCKLAPAGPHHMQDLYNAGGVYRVLTELRKANLLKNALPLGKTMGENLDNEVYRVSETQS